MKDKSQAHVALGPAAVDAGVIGRNPAFIGSVYGSQVETKSGFTLCKRGDFDALYALI